MRGNRYPLILLAVLALSACAKSIDLTSRYDEASRTLYLGDYAIPKIIDRQTGVGYLGKEYPIRMDQEVYFSRDATCYKVRVIKMTAPPHYAFNKPVHEMLIQRHAGTCSTEQTANLHFTRCVVERPASIAVPFAERSYIYYVSAEGSDESRFGRMMYRLPDEQCVKDLRAHFK